MSYDLIVRGGSCVSHRGVDRADVGVRDGRIAEIGDLAQADAAEEIDVTGCHVLPGAIDPQVHFREPGFEHKEDLETGTRAAVLGGITSVFEMPNTDPPTTHAAALEDKLRRAHGRAWCDVAFFVGATPDNAERLDELERLPGCAGVKVFMGKSTGNLLVHEDRDLERVLRSGRRRVAVHAEDEMRLQERAETLDLAKGGVAMHPEWRDVESAVRATRRLLEIAARCRRRVHVLHLTTAEEVDLIAAHRVWATSETTPQHLTLAAPECYAERGTRVQMNPPIRDDRHRRGLWRGVLGGVIDNIASDHAPHTLSEKAQPYPRSPAGMPGVQTLLPIMLDHVVAGRLSLELLVDLCCAGPARVWGAPRKGRLVIGGDADLSIIDLGATREIRDDWIASRCGWTPFDGRTVRGWPTATIVRGRVVMREDEVQGTPSGVAVEFSER
ncbi:MAG: dihydroorotase [Myxococcota bacterium]